MTTLQVNEYYYTKFEPMFCCDELSNVVYCYKHNEKQECGYCSADHYAPCECE